MSRVTAKERESEPGKWKGWHRVVIAPVPRVWTTRLVCDGDIRRVSLANCRLSTAISFLRRFSVPPAFTIGSHFVCVSPVDDRSSEEERKKKERYLNCVAFSRKVWATRKLRVRSTWPSRLEICYRLESNSTSQTQSQIPHSVVIKTCR